MAPVLQTRRSGELLTWEALRSRSLCAECAANVSVRHVIHLQDSSCFKLSLRARQLRVLCCVVRVRVLNAFARSCVHMCARRCDCDGAGSHASSVCVLSDQRIQVETSVPTCAVLF